MAVAHTMFDPAAGLREKLIPLSDLTAVINKIIPVVRPYTVVPDSGLAATIWLTINAVNSQLDGDIVECGVWRGGCSFAMLLAQREYFGRIHKRVWMYDSFEGMGEPAEQDGDNARLWSIESKSGKSDPYGQNYCVASIEEVIDAMTKLNIGSEHAILRKGWYEDTLGVSESLPYPISFLRVDCDWYDPCKLVYKVLVPNVSNGSPILMDDYYVWPGCTRATHEYLVENNLAWPIRSVEGYNGAWMIKRA